MYILPQYKCTNKGTRVGEEGGEPQKYRGACSPDSGAALSKVSESQSPAACDPGRQDPTQCTLTDVWVSDRPQSEGPERQCPAPGEEAAGHPSPRGACRLAPLCAADLCFCRRSHPCSRTMSASSPPRPSPPMTRTVTSRKLRRSVPSFWAARPPQPLQRTS